MTITKHIYSGNGFKNNIGYKVTDGETVIFIPALNNVAIYDEHYSDLIIETGDQLQNEAEFFLKNVFVGDAKNLIEALEYIKTCDKDFYDFKSSDEDYSDAQE
jgi:hypothetical protein